VLLRKISISKEEKLLESCDANGSMELTINHLKVVRREGRWWRGVYSGA
jgi:hypothetical protein